MIKYQYKHSDGEIITATLTGNDDGIIHLKSNLPKHYGSWECITDKAAIAKLEECGYKKVAEDTYGTS